MPAVFESLGSPTQNWSQLAPRSPKPCRHQNESRASIVGAHLASRNGAWPVTAIPPVASPADGWLLPTADRVRLTQLGIKTAGGGPHQSKTMMLADLASLFASGQIENPAGAIVAENLLGKPSIRAREAALYRLRQLYGVGGKDPIWRVLHGLWNRETRERPLLALLTALARDPLLRAGASAVLDASPGERVRWPDIAAIFETANPGRLSEKMAKSLAQNAASSWTQAGLLRGAVRKERVRANPTPAIAAFAALLSSLCGFGGYRLLDCRWMSVLDRPVEDRLALLRQAEGLGLVRVRSAGDVLEVDIRRPMADQLGVPELVS